MYYVCSRYNTKKYIDGSEFILKIKKYLLYGELKRILLFNRVQKLLKGVFYMNKIKIYLSFILSFVMILTSTVPTFAETFDEYESVENKCSDKVLDFLNNNSNSVSKKSNSDERLPVYIWYKDIDQDYVDSKTEEITGFSAEECSRIDDIYQSSLNYKSIDFSKSDEEILAEYIDSTSELRKIEKANVDRYKMTRREIAAQMYEEKSNNLINSIDIDNNFINFNSQYAPLIIADLSVSEIERARKLNSVELICYYEETECFEPTIESAL